MIGFLDLTFALIVNTMAADPNPRPRQDDGDLLLRSLVEEGVLTRKEAKQLNAQSRKEAEPPVALWQAAPDAPAWVQKLSMNADPQAALNQE